MDKKKIAIVGGGITGSAAAYFLQKEMLANNLNYEYKLFEELPKLGGKILTEYRDNFIIEMGPDSFIARKLSASKLAREIGMGDKLVYSGTGGSFVLNNEKLYKMPSGAIMGIPTEIVPFAVTRLFSPFGKLRAACDLFLPRVSDVEADMSLGAFFRKRLGDEVVDNLIEPLLSGIYAGDIDQLSLMATFPQFHQVEQKYRSLILGMKKGAPKKPKLPQQEQAKPKGMFLSFEGGLQSFVDGIEKRLDANAIFKGIGITNIKKVDNSYELTLSNGTVEQFDYVIMATPHNVTANIFSSYKFSELIKDIPSTSVATVAMAFPKSAIKTDINGSGYVVSRKSNYNITACTWTHKKWEHSAPSEYALLRGYVGRAGDDAIVNTSDEEITAAVLTDLNKTMKIVGEPIFTIIKRWQKAMPQYVVGHKQRIEMLNTALQEQLPGVYVAGGSYQGIGLPDCIDQASNVVAEIIKREGKSPSSL